jgi:peptide/nickel transport system permease protein
MRSSLLEVLGEDYVRTAWAKGLRERAVVLRHALRNALIPVVTIAGMSFGHLLGGAVIVETVFAWRRMAPHFRTRRRRWRPQAANFRWGPTTWGAACSAG